MNLPDKIKTIDDFKESIFKEKKSTFIAQVYSVSSADQAEEIISSTKKKYYDASHHCYAYKLTIGTSRYSDAGEPTGSAGVRILNAIEHFGLLNQLVIVIRYFGGVKLGVGPLGKAYYSAAYKVLNESEIKTKTLFQKVIITSEVDQFSRIHAILSGHHSLILKSDFQEEVIFECLIKSAEVDSIWRKLIEITKNKIKIKPFSEFVYK